MSEVKHGSESVVEKAAGPTAAIPAMAATAVRETSWATARSASPRMESMDPEDDLSISDDSFAMKTPPNASRRAAGLATSRGGARERLARKGSRQRQPMTIRSVLGDPKRRGRHRPPSPVVNRASIPDHGMVTPENATSEARLQALERQQAKDHVVFAEVISAVRSLQDVAEHQKAKHLQLVKDKDEYVGMGMRLRQEMYVIRDTLNENIKQVTAQAIPDGVKQLMQQGAGLAIGQAIEGKFSQLESLFVQLTGHVENLTNREGQVEQYLNEQSGVKTLEEQAVEGAFQHMDAKLSQVGEMVRRFETQGNPVTAMNIPFTVAMRDSMADIHKRMKAVDDLTPGCQALWDKANVATAAIESLSNASMTQHAKIKELERITASHNESLSVQSGLCGGGGGWSGYRPSSGACCSGAGGATPSPNPWTAGEPPAPSGTGAPSGSGDGDPLGVLRAVIGGNNHCHCIHVSELMDKVKALEVKSNSSSPARGDAPPPDFWAAAAGQQRPPNAPAATPHDAARAPAALPLALRGPLGAVGYKDRSPFDDKLTLQDDYRFNGSKGGLAWKGKVERYLIGKAPVLKELLEWVEKDEHAATNGVITFERLSAAVPRSKMTEDQLLTLDAAIWGFLSGALSGTAETIFKRAEMLRGFDAWRRIVRFLDHGSEIRLEQLRREVKTMHLKPIKDIESVEEGVADFENTLDEYVRAGGTPFKDIEKKSDLLAVLPASLRENLLWQASDKGDFYQFRDMILSQTAKVIMNRKRGHLNAVEHEEQGDDDEDQMQPVKNMAELIAAFNRMNGKGAEKGRWNERSSKAGGTGNPPGPPRPRKCPNCGETHPELKCPKPAVAPADRKCFFCNKKGHIGRNCPDKKTAPGGLRAIEDAQPEARPMFCLADEGDFQVVRRGKRPQPRGATIGDFIDKNVFAALAGDTSTNGSSSAAGSTGTARGSSPDIKVADLKGHKPGVIEVTEQELDALITERLMQSEILQRETERLPQTAPSGLEKPIKVSADSPAPAISMFLDEPDDLMGATTEEVTVSVAMDSGAVANAIHPDELPCDAQPEPNTTGRHFVGANNTRIEKYGTCTTSLEGEHGAVDCNWQLADVSRPLHSLSSIAGPIDGPGRQDVIFNNRICAVVPPGVVDEILKTVKPVAQYNRQGNLYVAKMKMRSFQRQGTQE